MKVNGGLEGSEKISQWLSASPCGLIPCERIACYTWMYHGFNHPGTKNADAVICAYRGFPLSDLRVLNQNHLILFKNSLPPFLGSGADGLLLVVNYAIFLHDSEEWPGEAMSIMIFL